MKVEKLKGVIKARRYTNSAMEELTVLEALGDIGTVLNEAVDVVNDVQGLVNGKVSHQEMKNTYAHEGSDFVGSWHGIERPQLADPGISGVVDQNVKDILWLREQKVVLEHEIRENDKELAEIRKDLEGKEIDISDLQEVVTNVKGLGFVVGSDVTESLKSVPIDQVLYFPKGDYLISELTDHKCYGSGVLVYGSERIELSNIPEKYNTDSLEGLRLQNVRLGNGSGVNMQKDARANVSVGYNSLNANVSGDRNTAIGNGSMFKGTNLYSMTAVGTDAIRCADFGDRGVYVGSNAGKWNGSADPKGDLHDFYLNEDDPFGLKAKNSKLEDIIGDKNNPKIKASKIDDNVNNTLIGRNAGLHTIVSTDCTAIGYNALAHGIKVDKVTAIGRGSLMNNVLGNNNVSVGALTSVECQNGFDNTVVGTYGMNVAVSPEKNTCVGYGAMRYNEIPRFNTAIGWAALNEGKTGISNTAVGNQSGLKTGGNGNTVVGSTTYNTATTGNYNTVIGFNAGNEKQDGTTMDGISGCIILGSNAKVTGGSQCQLGQAGTTTYAYGSVQDRSDERDKKDIRESVLGLDFIRQLVPVDYKWDYRGGVYDEETGRKKEFKRYHHGFIAQDVKRLIEDTGIDFGGFQDHSLNGGSDVLSLGYAEFIAPMVKAMREMDKKIRDLEKKLASKEV